LHTTSPPGRKARFGVTSTALLRWLGLNPPPDLTLPKPRTVKLADDRTDEWVARFRELQTMGNPG
jgi:LPS sulfotransferase NodH